MSKLPLFFAYEYELFLRLWNYFIKLSIIHKESEIKTIILQFFY